MKTKPFFLISIVGIVCCILLLIAAVPPPTGYIGRHEGDGFSLTNLNPAAFDVPTSNLRIGTGSMPSPGVGALYNVALGPSALSNLVSGHANVAVGYNALRFNTIGDDNVAIGDRALGTNVDGSFNVAVGHAALGSNTNGISNTAVGAGALASNLYGGQNSAVGDSAMVQTTNGSWNVAFGDSAGENLYSGNHNSALGHAALGGGINLASWNTAVGDISLFCTTTGSNNVAVGYCAMGSNTAGVFNTALGFCAGWDYASVDMASVLDKGMIFIGANASRSSAVPSSTPMTNAIAIGVEAKVAGSHQIVIGNDAHTNTILKGRVDVPDLRAGSMVVSNGVTLQSGTAAFSLSMNTATGNTSFRTLTVGREWEYGANAGAGMNDGTFSIFCNDYGATNGYVPILAIQPTGGATFADGLTSARFTVSGGIASTRQGASAPINIWTNTAAVTTYWTNYTGFSGFVLIGGGTVTAINLNYTSLGITANTGLSTVPVSPLGIVSVAYTGAPTMMWVFQ